MRRGALAAAAALLLAAPTVAALSGWDVKVEGARPVPAIGAGAVDLSAVELADGNLLFAYAAPSPSGGALVAVVTDGDGSLLQGPLAIAETGSTALEFSVAPQGDHGAAVVWVAGSTPSLSLFDGSSFSTVATDAFPGVQVTSCQVAAPADRLVLACDSVALPPVRPFPQVVLAQIAVNGSLLAPVVAVSATPPAPSFLRGLTVDGLGTSWVAFQSPSRRDVNHVDLALAALDAAGNATTPPTVLLPDALPADVVELAPSPLSDGAVWVAFAQSGAPTGNSTLHLESWRPGESVARFAATFEGGALRAVDTAFLHGQGPGGSVGALAWLEADPLNASGPSASARLRLVLLDENLSALEPASAPLGDFSPGARFVGSGSSLVDGPSPATLHRIAIAPPSAGLPAHDLTAVALAIFAGTGAATLTLAGLSDRFKWALLAAVWPLYVVRDRILVDNLRRGAILQVVSETPGIHFKDLAIRTGISQGALRHHLRVLDDFGFVSMSFGRRSLTVYPTGENPIRQAPFREIRAQILREVRIAPGITHAELARRVGVRWNTLSYHMDALREAKKVRLWRRTQVRRYYPVDEA